jgi:preprotein translocase subunit Sss1
VLEGCSKVFQGGRRKDVQEEGKGMKVVMIGLLLGGIVFLIMLLGKCMLKGIREKEEGERIFRRRGNGRREKGRG